MAPDRVRGLIAEMPVLDNALDAGLVAFAPLMFAARYLPFTIDGLRLATKAVPRGVVPFWAGIVLDTMNQRSGAMAATMHGLLFGRIAPPSRIRETLEMPALVVGHRRDPIHPAADAAMLAEEMPHATFVESHSILEWRFRPERLDAVAVGFVDECYADGAARRARGSVRPDPLYVTQEGQ